jgi:ABC-type antimicrobial peptide transport system permease subunit
MFKNYLTIAWRNLAKSKVYSSINIVGLAVGMAVALLISLWVFDELSYNKGFNNHSHIVRVMENSTHGGETLTFNSMPIPLAGEFRTKYGADFKKVALASWNQPNIIAFGDKKLSKSGMFVQPDFPAIFTMSMLEGSWHCVDDPSSIAINKSLAVALFGNEDPVNKVIKFNNKKNFKVSGVFADFPHNSEFNDVTYLASWAFYVADENWVKQSQTEWDNNSFQIFAQLQDMAVVDKVGAKVQAALTGHNRNDKPGVLLHPMAKWHLYDEFKGGVNTGGAIQFVWMFGIIGAFVLLLACINFMNLSTARSEKRAKEVGIRKAVGSHRKQLVFQFLCESVLIALIAFALALLLTLLALPWFNNLADKHMGILWGNPLFWLAAIGFALITGIISGSYPALYLSSFNSVKVLKGTFKAGRFASIPRKVLVVLQFSVSVSLIIGTIVVYTQIQYAKNRPIGYSRDGLITINMSTPELFGHYGTMRTDVINSGGAVNMAESSSPTTGIWSNQSSYYWRGKDPNFVPTFGTIAVTHDFGKTVGWQFTQGRDFSRDYGSDSSAMILNEAAVKYMGLANPVGEVVKRGTDPGKNFRVIGIIKDMVMESPFEPAKPTVFMMDYEWANVITIKLNQRLSARDALAKVEAVFKKYNPGSPFEYSFNDDDYAKKFGAEERVSSLATFFAIFAIFISCLGLFGLASFTAEQRTKEIGVRKVLGASVINVWGLLSKDFVLLVFISFFIAIPVASYAMNKWLLGYKYHTTISLWIFAATAGAALVITLITVSFQAIKAALSNPVKSLRTE